MSGKFLRGVKVWARFCPFGLRCVLSGLRNGKGAGCRQSPQAQGSPRRGAGSGAILPRPASAHWPRARFVNILAAAPKAAAKKELSRKCRSPLLFHPPLRQGGDLRPFAAFPGRSEIGGMASTETDPESFFESVGKSTGVAHTTG